jgi:hypothetical protein
MPTGISRTPHSWRSGTGSYPSEPGPIRLAPLPMTKPHAGTFSLLSQGSLAFDQPARLCTHGIAPIDTGYNLPNLKVRRWPSFSSI